jgi:hypothetical protein
MERAGGYALSYGEASSAPSARRQADFDLRWNVDVYVIFFSVFFRPGRRAKCALGNFSSQWSRHPKKVPDRVLLELNLQVSDLCSCSGT